MLLEGDNCSYQGTDSDSDKLNSTYLQTDRGYSFTEGQFLPFILHGIWVWDMAAWMELPSDRKLKHNLESKSIGAFVQQQSSQK